MKYQQSIEESAVESAQTASSEFFIAIAAAYVCVCLTWVLAKNAAGSRWSSEDVPRTDRKWLDLIMVGVAALGIFAIGAAYRGKWLLPDLPGEWSYLTTAINLCLPYLGIAVCLAIRKQSMLTIWLSPKAIGWKLGIGALAALVGLFVYYVFRSDLASLPTVFPKAMTLDSLSHAPAVFMEAVAIAFFFVRLRWVVGPLFAILIPSLIFALGHVPSGIEDGQSINELAAFFVFNTLLPAGIFAVLMHTRDVIWIAIPHYLLDIAIDAFS